MRTTPVRPLLDRGNKEITTGGSAAVLSEGQLARLQAGAREQAMIERDRPVRAEIAAAIHRAEQGDELSILDIDLDDMTQREAYDQALTDVHRERERRDRSAAVHLAIKRLGRNVPR